MRPASYYYLAQNWRPNQSQPASPSRPKSRGRHARASQRDHAGRELQGFARRVLAVFRGTSQPA